MPVGHDYGPVWEARQYQERGQFLSAAAPFVAEPSSRSWGYEVWSGRTPGGRFTGSLLAAATRGAGDAQQTNSGDWAASAGGWLFAWKPLAAPAAGWP
jgi:hypothetical protein